MKAKRIIKTALGLTAAGVTLGAGANIFDNMGSAGSTGSKTMTAFGSQLPTLGSVAGAGMVLSEIRSFGKGKKKKR